MLQNSRIPPGLLTLWLACAGGPALAQSITEFAIPTASSHPFNIAAGPGGMWFTEESASRIGRIDADGHVTEFPVNRPAWGIVAGPDGNLWFTSDRSLSRMTPDGIVTEFALSGKGSGVTVGPDGNIWFTESSSGGNHVGRATLDGRITEFAATNDSPWFITSGPDGNLWFTDFGELVPTRIARLTPAGTLTEFRVPVGHAAAIVAGPDGNLWFTALGHQGVGRMSPSGDTVVYAADTGYGIAAGPDGHLWFTSADGNKVFRMSTGGVAVGVSVPTPGAYPLGISAGPDGNIWFTESEANRIGRVNLTAATSGSPLVLAGGRFQITVDWQTATRSGQGIPVLLTPDTGYFWFFDSANVEVVVKVLDVCASFGHEWVFAGGLTAVGVTMTVTDSQTGTSKTYSNPRGTAFPPIQDTGTFACAAGPLSGDWTGNFASVDFFECNPNVSAHASFEQNGSAVDGFLSANRDGCGAEHVALHGTLEGGVLEGTITGGRGPYHFDADSSVRGILSGTTLQLKLINGRYGGIPGGTMRLHR